MTEKEASSRIQAVKAGAIVALLILAVALVFWFVNRPANGAEAKVKAELEALQDSDSLGSEVDTLRKSLSAEGRENFDTFTKKLRDFDYEILGSSRDGDGEGERTAVTVRIRSRGFGREYLAAWTDYLKGNGGALPADGELTDFYEMLFERLAGLEDREYIKDVEIICVEPLGNDEWAVNIKDNEELQDAIFGGMMSEMKTLAAE